MSDNFLPEFRLAETQGPRGNKVRCQVRGYEVPATPEEQVRQRVLHWLINTKLWRNLRLEKAYRWESDANRSHVRPDIELLDDDENVVVVVECKHEGIKLSEAVNNQAIEYAIKSGAPQIWITNGEQHRFLECSSRPRLLAGEGASHDAVRKGVRVRKATSAEPALREKCDSLALSPGPEERERP